MILGYFFKSSFDWLYLVILEYKRKFKMYWEVGLYCNEEGLICRKNWNMVGEKVGGLCELERVFVF